MLKVILTSPERQPPRSVRTLVAERTFDATRLSPRTPRVDRVTELRGRLPGREQPPWVPGVQRGTQFGDAHGHGDRRVVR